MKIDDELFEAAQRVIADSPDPDALLIARAILRDAETPREKAQRNHEAMSLWRAMLRADGVPAEEVEQCLADKYHLSKESIRKLTNRYRKRTGTVYGKCPSPELH
jgi:hypothetical protein